jgi:hypothetical protein
MSDALILNFPVLKQDSGDFLDSIVYTVGAVQLQDNRKIIVTHALKGESFISELLRSNKAKFSVSLFYKDNAERQNFVIDEYDYDEDAQEITAEQNIDVDFNYAPEIIPSIVVVNNEKITVNDKSGLTNFWKNEKFDILAYSRIAHHFKLNFSSGDVSGLMWKEMDEDYSNGSLKTIVTETISEGEQPIKIICAQDVYDELDRGLSGILDEKIAMRQSIITQVLCHVYAYMGNLEDKESDIHSGLLQHMETLEEKTGEDWKGDEFNASFAATKNLPYAIKAINSESR